MTFEKVMQAAVGNELGEGVLWDDTAQRFVWIDIQRKLLQLLDWNTRAVTQIDLPFRAGSIALTDRPDTYLIAFEHGFAIFDVQTRALDWVARPPLKPGVRFNDGRVDPTGRFVAGTMVEDADAAGGTTFGTLYRLAGRDRCEQLLTEIHITNSLCWSPDGKHMYHSDTPRGLLMRYDYARDTAHDGKVLARFEQDALPDGATCDADGNVWVALWGGSRVEGYSPEGTLVHSLAVPAKQPTCVAFGGPNLDCLAVTSAWEGLANDPTDTPEEAGNLFVFKTDARGRKERRVLLSSFD